MWVYFQVLQRVTYLIISLFYLIPVGIGIIHEVIKYVYLYNCIFSPDISDGWKIQQMSELEFTNTHTQKKAKPTPPHQ